MKRETIWLRDDLIIEDKILFQPHENHYCHQFTNFIPFSFFILIIIYNLSAVVFNRLIVLSLWTTNLLNTHLFLHFLIYVILHTFVFINFESDSITQEVVKESAVREISEIQRGGGHIAIVIRWRGTISGYKLGSSLN